MKIQTLFFALVLCLFCQYSLAQDDDYETEFDSEVEAVDPLPERSEQILEETASQKELRLRAEEEARFQEEFARKKHEQEGSLSDAQNRYPRSQPLFKKPPGPKKGGVVTVPHPRAKEGLVRIESDGTYRYKTATKIKTQSASVRLSSMTTPVIAGEYGGLTFDSMYGSDPLFGFVFDYDWKPFKDFGNFGLLLGTGLSFAQGSGTFKNSGQPAREKYNLYVIPMSVFINYRFEYMRRQWIVPFINGGGTYYGLVESRDDGKSPTLAGAPAVGGGGGLHISISRMDEEGAFTMSREYGISDMWLTLEARVMQGLKSDIDFTSQAVNVGVTVDY